MKVKIESPIGSNTYEMSEQNVMRLMLTAYRVADTEAKGEPVSAATVKEVDDALEKSQCKPGEAMNSGRRESAAEHGSRTERMFGKRETWNGGADEAAPDEADGREKPVGWKGFLILRCPDCGEVRSFFSRDRITSNRCSCGCVYDLEDLLPAHVHCGKCGKYLKYRTNINYDYPITVDCLGCHAPIDLQLNVRGTAVVPVGDIKRGGGGYHS